MLANAQSYFFVLIYESFTYRTNFIWPGHSKAVEIISTESFWMIGSYITQRFMLKKRWFSITDRLEPGRIHKYIIQGK